ncbi:hypothetical protein HID58_055654, partial [Brassica napus]
ELHFLGLGQSLVVFNVVFLVVGLPSIVLARLGFQDLVSVDMTPMFSFIARGRFHSLLISFSLPFFVCSLISLYLSSLFASLVSLPFTMFVTLVFSSMYAMWAWKVVVGLKLELWFFGGWLTFFFPHIFVVICWHGRLHVLVEFVKCFLPLS